MIFSISSSRLLKELCRDILRSLINRPSISLNPLFDLQELIIHIDYESKQNSQKMWKNHSFHQIVMFAFLLPHTHRKLFVLDPIVQFFPFLFSICQKRFLILTLNRFPYTATGVCQNISKASSLSTSLTLLDLQTDLLLI